VKAAIWLGTLKGAKLGSLAALGLALLYIAIGALGNTELTKSVGFSLLLIGFPTFFAVESVLRWLGVQGGMREWVAAVLPTLVLNGALWGAVVGAAVALRSPGHGGRIRN